MNPMDEWLRFMSMAEMDDSGDEYDLEDFGDSDSTQAPRAANHSGAPNSSTPSESPDAAGQRQGKAE